MWLILVKGWTNQYGIMLKGTGKVNPVRPNVSIDRPNVSTGRPKVNPVRPVSTARSFVPKIAQTGGVIRPIYPRMDNVRPRASSLPINRAVVNAGKGKMDNTLNGSKWVWRPKGNYMNHGNPEIFLQDHAVVDSGCSSHMTGNKASLSEYEDYNGGFMAFGSDPKRGRITSKGKIKMAHLDFDDVYFIDELKFNLFSVSQMCDKKNSVLFTETECLILSPSFKLLDESQVVLRAPRKDDVYSLDLKNVIPSRGIKREFSVARTPQKNGVAERKNRTLIEAARTMLVDSLLPIPFWAEAVNTACYVLNRVLVTKPQNKTPYELLIGIGPDWMFDLDFLTNIMNYIPVSVENQVNVDAGTQESYVAGKDKEPTQEYILHPIHPHGPRISVEDVVQAVQEIPSKANDVQNSKDVVEKEEQHKPSVSTASTPTGANASGSSFFYLGGQIPIDASTLPNADLPTDLNMPGLEDDSDLFPNEGIFSRAYDDEDVGAEADFNNMDNSIDVSPIPTLRIHKDHPKGQILGDPKSVIQTRGKIQKASSVQQALMKAGRAMQEDCCSSNLTKVLVAHGLIEKGIDYDEVLALLPEEVQQQPDGIFISQDKVCNLTFPLMFDFGPSEQLLLTIETSCLMYVPVLDFRSHYQNASLIFSKNDLLGNSNITKLGLWYPWDSPFELDASQNWTIVRARLDRKSQQLLTVVGKTSMDLRMDGSCAGSFTHIWSVSDMSLLILVNSGRLQVNTEYKMANLRYSNKHNMVAFLKKPNKSVGFTEIVDFLKGSSLRYALTHNPTIYDSLVKQFWQTVTVRTLANGIQELVASIDNKEYTITEASVKSKLHLADATGTTEDQGEGLAIPVDPHHTPIDPVPSTSQPLIPSTTEPPHSSPPRTEGATTTITGLDAGLDSELMEIVPKLESKVDSLKKELKETKHTLGNVVLTLVKKVKSLEVALKRKTKKMVLSDSKDEETEN
ncbi:ribonuclease H-like domain-containing protein [Tanacetum coccineum]